MRKQGLLPLLPRFCARAHQLPARCCTRACARQNQPADQLLGRSILELNAALRSARTKEGQLVRMLERERQRSGGGSSAGAGGGGSAASAAGGLSPNDDEEEEEGSPAEDEESLNVAKKQSLSKIKHNGTQFRDRVRAVERAFQVAAGTEGEDLDEALAAVFYRRKLNDRPHLAALACTSPAAAPHLPAVSMPGGHVTSHSLALVGLPSSLMPPGVSAPMSFMPHMLSSLSGLPGMSSVGSQSSLAAPIPSLSMPGMPSMPGMLFALHNEHSPGDLR